MSCLRRIAVPSVLLITSVLGCSGTKIPDELKAVPFVGRVTLDGKPVALALVTFIPLQGTNGFGASGSTDAAGRFTLQCPDGQTGVVPGAYKVTVATFFRGEGYIPEPGELTQNDATQVPPIYADEAMTPLSATVSSQGGTQDFELKSSQK